MLSPVESESLETLITDGDNVPAGIADNIDRHPKSVSRSLSSLREKRLVRRKNDYGVWTPTQEGKEYYRNTSE